jgi:hypothetical protein
MSRRVSGVVSPSRDDLSAWSGTKRLDKRVIALGGCSAEAVAELRLHVDRRAFMGVVFLEMNHQAALLAHPSGSTLLGPARRTIGAIVGSGSPFFQAFERGRRRLKPEVLQADSPTILPLVGLDRVPVVLVVWSDRLEDTALVAHCARLVRLGETGSFSAAGAARVLREKRGNTASAWAKAWAESPAVAETVTIVGPALHRVPPQEAAAAERSPPADAATRDGAAITLPEPWSFTPGGGPDQVAIAQGGLRVDLRLSALVGWDDLRRCVKHLQLKIGPTDDAFHLGEIDATLHTAPGPLTLRGVHEIMVTLRGLTPASGPALHTGILSTTVPWVTLEHSSPLARQEIHLLGFALDRRLQAAGQHHLASGRAGAWMARWRAASLRLGLSRPLTTAGAHLLSRVIHLLRDDIPTFAALVGVVDHLLRYAEGAPPPHVVETDHRDRPPDPREQLIHLLDTLDDFLSLREQRGTPVRRAPSPSSRFESLIGFDVSRMALAAVVSAEARRLGGLTVLMVEDLQEFLRATHRPSGVIELAVPRGSYFQPETWMIGHELAHGRFRSLEYASLATDDRVKTSWDALWSVYSMHAPKQRRKQPSVLHDLFATLHHCATSLAAEAGDQQVKLMNALTTCFVEVAADLVGLHQFRILNERNRPASAEAQRRFWWATGTLMVREVRAQPRATQGPDPLLLQTILRVYLVSIVLRGNSRTFLQQRGAWITELWSFLDPSSSPKPSDPIRRRLGWLCRDLGSDRPDVAQALSQVLLFIQKSASITLDAITLDKGKGSHDLIREALRLCVALFERAEWTQIDREDDSIRRELANHLQRQISRAEPDRPWASPTDSSPSADQTPILNRATINTLLGLAHQTRIHNIEVVRRFIAEVPTAAEGAP